MLLYETKIHKEPNIHSNNAIYPNFPLYERNDTKTSRTLKIKGLLDTNDGTHSTLTISHSTSIFDYTDAEKHYECRVQDNVTYKISIPST